MGVSLLAVRHTEPEERPHGESLHAHPYHPRLSRGARLSFKGSALRSYDGIMPVCKAHQRCVASKLDKSMNQQKNCARVGTQHLRIMPVSILVSPEEL